MQNVWDACQHLCVQACVTTDGIKKRRRPVFMPEIGHDEVVQALEACNYKQLETAEMLGIPPAVLRYRIKKYKITHPRWYANKPE
jgi:transcriptional regulator with GAF, ATPase, and Fis domain